MSAASEQSSQPTPARLSPLRFIPQHWVQIVQLLAALVTTVALAVIAALSLRPQSGSAKSVNRLAGHFHEQQYVAICAIVKDQPLDISFWLNYHFHMGVSKFYLYDNNSTPPMSNVLQDEIDDDLVQYNWFDAWATQPHQNAQMYVYDRCIQKHKSKHKWIAFIDVDEFFVLHDPKHRQFQDLLPAYEQYGGLAANWVMMGSSGLKERPSDPNPFNSYEMCSPMDGPAEYHVKTIVNTDHVAHVISPHSFAFAPGSPPPVTEDGEPIFRHFSVDFHAKLISLYHFVLKSREDFAGKPSDACLTSGTVVVANAFCLAGKVARRSGDGTGKDWPWFDAMDGISFINCTEFLGMPRMPWPESL